MPNLSRAASSDFEVDELSRDVANLRNTEKKTQESLELVHGTLGHVVDRLAMIETDIRGRAAPTTENLTLASVAAPVTPKALSRSGSASPGPLGSSAREPTGKTEVSPKRAASLRPQALAPSAELPRGPTLADPATRNGPTKIEREAIDPTLPPDHPLEPGLGGARRTGPASAAERIAASESVLAAAKPAVAAQPGTKSNFIAAARRAAQAGREAPAKNTAPETKEASSVAGKLATRVGKLRALIGGTTGILIVLGGFQIAKMFLGGAEDSDVAQMQAPAIIAAPERAPDVPVAAEVNWTAAPVNQPPPTKPNSEPSSSPQSSAIPAAARSPLASGNNTAIERERQPTEAAPPTPAPLPAASGRSVVTAAEREITGSIPSAAAPASSALAPVGTPVTPAPAQHAPAIPPADKLPAPLGTNLRAAAAKGDANAQYEIAQRYAEGRGVAQNLTEAAEWFERAAKHGLVPAQFRLGGLYEKGLGVKKNLETARRLYITAGEAGSAKAMHNVAVLYAEGIDGKPDYATAARWFRKAADYGVTDSQYNLAVLYARGIGVEQNMAEAYKWFALAARDGDADSAKKRDDLAARLDRNALSAVTQAVEGWVAQQQPANAIEVKGPAGGWDQAASPTPLPSRKVPVGGPTLDLATPRVGQ
ncbi:MAG: hypothetical protein E6G96_13445 [Alphaproteobacteria bacterium]|nr:MAG: hypothetical protein E6G96_13445 [Alphaproteobacteria bacterium]